MLTAMSCIPFIRQWAPHIAKFTVGVALMRPWYIKFIYDTQQRAQAPTQEKLFDDAIMRWIETHYTQTQDASFQTLYTNVVRSASSHFATKQRYSSMENWEGHNKYAKNTIWYKSVLPIMNSSADILQSCIEENPVYQCGHVLEEEAEYQLSKASRSKIAQLCPVQISEGSTQETVSKRIDNLFLKKCEFLKLESKCNAILQYYKKLGCAIFGLAVVYNTVRTPSWQMKFGLAAPWIAYLIAHY